MSSPGRVPGATQNLRDNGSSPSASRPAAMGNILPPIVAPPDNMSGREGPHSASSVGRPGLSRTSSVSSETSLPKMHHLLNPSSTQEKTSAPPTPEAASQPRPFPSQPLARGSTPTSSPYGPPPQRLTAPLGNPTGTIDAKKSPFLPTTNHGPPMIGGHSGPSVNPVLGPRPAHTFPQTHLPGIAGPGSRRGSDFGNVQSRTGSPASSSISSYGQPSTTQGSPRSDYSSITQATQYNPQHPPPYPMQQPVAPPGMPQPHPGPQYAQHPHVQYAQHPNQPHQTILQPTGPYQLLTLETDTGPIQVPVDVQAASKMADEKRKRNAGASARFRQRRKEKERESAQTISKLESKVRDLENDREFYRMERNYFRDLVYTHEGAKANLVARLPSPGPLSERNRQTSLASSRDEGGLSPSSAGGPDYRETGDRASDDGRIVRQRISGYEPQASPAQQYAQQHQQHHPDTGSSGSSQRNHPHLQIQTHMHASAEQPLQHHHHPQPPPPPHQQQQTHVQRHSAPPPISVQQANAQYSLPTPESRAGTPGSAPLQLNIPSALRSVPYDSANRSAPPVTYETRWAAPS